MTEDRRRRYARYVAAAGAVLAEGFSWDAATCDAYQRATATLTHLARPGGAAGCFAFICDSVSTANYRLRLRPDGRLFVVDYRRPGVVSGGTVEQVNSKLENVWEAAGL